jgi:membrane protease YdiL (CAAX protease family)
VTTPEDEPYTGPPPTRPPAPLPWPYAGGPAYPSAVRPPWYGPTPGGPVPPPGWAPAPPPGWQSFPPSFPPPYPPPYLPPGPPPLPPGLTWEPPPGTPPHDEPQPFLRAMRSRTWAWWRPVAGLALMSVVYVVAATALVMVAVVTGITPDLALLDLVDPAVLLVTNISLILFVPAVWLAWAVAHGMRIGWSASVLARIRPRLFLPWTLLALPTLGVGVLLSVAAGMLLGPDAVTGPVPSLGWLLLVVFLTTPLQSAAEEYLFRGYLSQTIAGWFRSERAGAITAAVVTAALFSWAHLPGDIPTFLHRFVFALAASATVWLTGGLEAAMVLHAVNNVLVFTLAGLLGEGIASEESTTGAALFDLLLITASCAGYVALVARARKRVRPELLTEARDLRPSGELPPAPWTGPFPGPWRPQPATGR